MTQGMNGVNHMGADNRDAKEMAQEALNVAAQASNRAMAASDHALDAHTRIGGLAGEMGRLSSSVDALKLAMITGFQDLGIKLRTDIAAEVEENTAVRNLRRENRQLKSRWKWVAAVLTSILVVVLAAGAVHALGWR